LAQPFIGTSWFIRAHDAKNKRLIAMHWKPVEGVYEVGSIECIITKSGEAQGKRNATGTYKKFTNAVAAVAYFDTL
jgi:hypothetical protein